MATRGSGFWGPGPPGRRGLLSATRPALLLIALAACEASTELVQPPPSDSTGGGNNGGTVQRADFSVRVVAASKDSAAAEAAGWTGAAIPGAAVSIRRIGAQETGSATTDAEGWVRFSGLLPGFYSVSATRLVGPDEAARLAGTPFADVNAFGGGITVEVGPPADTARVSVLAGKRGSLVISEASFVLFRSQTQGYSYADYLELYNNSDTTIFLDGKVVALGFWYVTYTVTRPCDATAHLRLDPDGIWSEWHVAFPGSGRDYPLAPGATAILARDAIDHGQFWPGAPDLSGAAFESIGAADVDNPSVPNVIDIGVRRWDTSIDRHGWFLLTRMLLALTEPFDTALAEHATMTDPIVEHRRIPKDKILDVIGVMPEPGTVVYPIGETLGVCFPVNHPDFDQEPAAIGNSSVVQSIHRRILGQTPGGRFILQRTGTSAADLERRAMSPGRVP